MTTAGPDNLRAVESKTGVTYQLPRRRPAQFPKEKANSAYRTTDFSDEEISHVSADYITWCIAHHGAQLTADDPEIYAKVSHLLAVMTGLSFPPFVLHILKTTHRKSQGKLLGELEMTLTEEVVKKLEALRRNTCPRREFAQQIGQVLTAMYKLFYDAVNSMPERDVQQSMTDLSVGVWGKINASAAEKIGPASAKASRPAVKIGSFLRIPPVTGCSPLNGPALDTLLYAPKPLPKPTVTKVAAPVPIHPSFDELSAGRPPQPAEGPPQSIEIRFTLNGLTDGRDPKHSLYPVLSGTSVVMEPTIDTGERSEKVKGNKWKRLRRVGHRIQRVLVGAISSAEKFPRTDPIHFRATSNRV